MDEDKLVQMLKHQTLMLKKIDKLEKETNNRFDKLEKETSNRFDKLEKEMATKDEMNSKFNKLEKDNAEMKEVLYGVRDEVIRIDERLCVMDNQRESIKKILA